MSEHKIPKIKNHLPTNPSQFKVLRFFVSMALAAGFLMFYYNYAGMVGYVGLTWPLGIMFVCYYLLGFSLDEIRYTQATKKFQASLPAMECDFLVALTKSPESTRLERELIVDYLNETYPGWSLPQPRGQALN